ncbi:sugar O-acetyltransferase [soil metagenome]
MKEHRIKIILFSLLFALLFLPKLQQFFPVFKFDPLNGEFIPAEKQKITMAGWFEGNFQKAYDKYFEENIGFRNPLIRFYNQVDFSCFRLAHGGDIVVGKEGYLFKKEYLIAHAGKDYIGEKEIDQRIERLKYVTAQLAVKGVHVIVIFAPTKADFYSEYIPSYYSANDTTPTNYDSYRKKLWGNGINFIDFNDYFLKLKKNSLYPLFPKQGIHWSQYGMYLASDSLVKYIREKTNLDLNELHVDSINVSYDLKSTDYDLGNLCNVLADMKHVAMPYPVLRFENNPTKKRPNVLTIGDSFYWNIYYSGILQHIFNGANFWYYNHDVYADSIPGKGVVDPDDFMFEVEQQQVVVLLQTESNLNNVGLGFIDNAYAMLQNHVTDDPVAKMEYSIRTNLEWFASIKKKAAEKNIPLDEMVRSDAEWMVEKERAKKN